MLACALFALLLLGAWAAWSFIVDDTFITFRYARHLAEGIGPVWNPGGQRVEGFTDFAWMIWNALGATLGIPLTSWVKLTSLLCAIGTLWLLLRTAWRRGGLGASAIAGLSYVLFLPTFFHITGGLETTAVALVLLRLVVLGLRVLDGQRVRAWEPPVLLLLAGTLRPEGALAALPVLLLWLWRGRRAPANWWCAGGGVLIGLGYFCWRWWYYGQLLPNTFYVKFGNLESGWLWTVHTGKLVLPLALLTLSLLSRRNSRAAGALLAVTVALTYLTYAVSGPTMDYLDRFAQHAFPVLCLGAGLGAAAIGKRVAVAAVGAVAVGWTAWMGVSAPDLAVMANYGSDLSRAHIPIGQGLAASSVPARERSLAVGDAGAIPYYSDWHSIDYIGLNDVPIAHGADPTRVLTEAKPTVLVLTSAGPELPASRYGIDNAVVTRGYVHALGVQMRDGYWQHLYVLPRYAEAVRQAVQPRVERAERIHDPGHPEDTIARWLHRLSAQLPG